MIGFLKGLLSSDKIITGGMAALDKSFLTEEEKLDYKLKFIAATMPMNRARRFMTITITAVWALHACTGLGLFLLESARFAEYIGYMTTNISAPFGVALAFYYYNGKTAKS